MTLQVFFDYSCPYCLQGHENLLALLRKYPDFEIDWRPCEAHPRPETHEPHSDLPARGMYIARKLGADIMRYHEIMYHAALNDHADIDNATVVAQLVGEICDSKLFADALNSGKYIPELDENNRLVWDVYDCPAVPSYCGDGKLLKSVGGVGVTLARLGAFLAQQ